MPEPSREELEKIFERHRLVEMRGREPGEVTYTSIPPAFMHRVNGLVDDLMAWATGKKECEHPWFKRYNDINLIELRFCPACGAERPT